MLIWLSLGAAAQRERRALLRPVVHAFVRGVAGGVVTFPLKAASARLALSAEEVGPDDQGLFRLPLMTCTTCADQGKAEGGVHATAGRCFSART